MNTISDGVVKRAALFMGFSDLQTRMFMQTKTDTECAELLQDAIECGFNKEIARTCAIAFANEYKKEGL